MSLLLENLHKRYGETRAVDGASFELGEGEILALLGPSGCGKSTLLRLVAGLEQPDRGRVVLDGRDITELPPQHREFGMVFQDYALFPHLNVARNVAFGLVELGWPRERQNERVEELLELVGLAGYQRRRVQELSGGEQQRVALARALAPEPSVLLLDEPLSNLDQSLRQTLKRELKRVLQTLCIRSIYVTHDQEEAFTLAERVAVMRTGRIQQVARREDLLTHPGTVWLARFLGYRNLFSSSQLARPRATGAPVPEGRSALLRSDLIRFGGPLAAEATELERVGMLRRLKLTVPAWDLRLHWEGFERELPEDLRHDLPAAAAGAVRVGLDIPEQAWVPLEDA